MGRLRLWLVMLPLVAAGVEAGTAVLDSFAPKEYETAELFGGSTASHALLVPALAIGVAVLLGAVWACARAGARAVRLPRWVFACLPLLVFAAQEHLEYVIGHRQVPWTLAADHTFLAGLALQAPFALAAYLAARLLVAAAAAIAARRAAPPVARPASIGAAPAPAPFHRFRLAGTCRLTRGPPLLAS